MLLSLVWNFEGKSRENDKALGSPEDKRTKKLPRDNAWILPQVSLGRGSESEKGIVYPAAWAYKAPAVRVKQSTVEELSNLTHQDRAPFLARTRKQRSRKEDTDFLSVRRLKGARKSHNVRCYSFNTVGKQQKRNVSEITVNRGVRLRFLSSVKKEFRAKKPNARCLFRKSQR